MNNMYDIIEKMKLLEARGSKPDFLDLDKDGDKKEPMKKAAKEVDESMDEASVSYSAKAARAGKDIGKPGKQFAKIAKSAGERYGSKERGEKVAGAVLAKLRAKESVEESDMDESALQAYLGKKKYGEEGMKALQKAGREGAGQEKMAKIRKHYDKMDEADMEEGNDFTGARLAAIRAGKPTFTVGGKTYKVTGDTRDEKQQIDELDINLIKAAQKHSKAHPSTKDPESERNIHKKYGSRSDRDETDDEDYDEWGNEKKGAKKSHVVPGEKRSRGRPKGSKRAVGAKVKGTSKLHSKPAIKEEGFEDEESISLVDKGEYDREGDMAREQLHTVMDAAKELHSILDADDNLPEWVQSKITKALDYLDTARDYVKASDAEDAEAPIAEKAVSKAQQRFMGMVHAAQKGEKPASKEVAKVAKEMPKKAAKDFAKTKHKGLPEKVKKEVEETTVSGSVATGEAEAPKSKKGMVFGKGVYESKLEESYKSRLEVMLTEGLSINANQGEDGKKSLTVNATDEDAEKLAQILKLAGMPQGHDYHDVCPACGQDPCGCEGMAEGEYSNSPDIEVSDTDTMVNTLSGGLNGRKSTGQTTIPVLNRDPARQGVTAVAEEIREQQESRLWNLYKKYEGK